MGGGAVCPSLRDRYNQLREQNIRAQDAYALAKDPNVDIQQIIQNGVPEWNGPIDYSAHGLRSPRDTSKPTVTPSQ